MEKRKHIPQKIVIKTTHSLGITQTFHGFKELHTQARHNPAVATINSQRCWQGAETQQAPVIQGCHGQAYLVLRLNERNQEGTSYIWWGSSPFAQEFWKCYQSVRVPVQKFPGLGAPGCPFAGPSGSLPKHPLGRSRTSLPAGRCANATPEWTVVVSNQ